MRLERLPTPDGDWLTVASIATSSSRPRVLILHGLEGSLRSHYLSGLVRVAESRGWGVSVLLFRTCDGTMGRVRRTYHSGETQDLDLVVRHLVSEATGSPIGLIGISLGGNVLLKWLGENRESVPDAVKAAVAVSVPFDLERCSRAIDTGFARLYQWNFLRSLKDKARRKISQFPDLAQSGSVESIRTMWDFDDRFTAPLHGFRDARDYYERASSMRFLAAIRRPTLLVSAMDDPFHTPSVLRDVEAASTGNPHVLREFHDRGGHVGFVGGAPWKPQYYLDQRIGDFLSGHLDHPATEAGRSR